MKKKIKRNLGIDLVNLKVLLRRNSRRLGFLCDCIIEVFSRNVLKNMFIMLLFETQTLSSIKGDTENMFIRRL